MNKKSYTHTQNYFYKREMDLGLVVSDNCLTTYQEMRMDKKHRYVIFATTADNKDIVVEKIGAREETYEDFVQSLPEN